MSDEIKNLVQKVADFLIAQNSMMVTVESCTGGGLAHVLTSLAGSSKWFERGLVTYSNQSKSEMLEIPEALISRHGAVSDEIAKLMSICALRKSEGDYVISITGIAGPDGGTPEKPVGLVYFGFASLLQENYVDKQIFSGNREQIRHQAIQYALQKFLEYYVTGSCGQAAG